MSTEKPWYAVSVFDVVFWTVYMIISMRILGVPPWWWFLTLAPMILFGKWVGHLVLRWRHR